MKGKATRNVTALVVLLMALLSCAQHSSVPTPPQVVAGAFAPAPNSRSFPAATQSPAPTARPIVTLSVTPPLAVLPSAAVPTSLPPVKPPDRTQIALVMMLDYASHHLTASETITYTNRTVETLSELVLAAEPNRWPGAFRLNELRWDDNRSIERYRLEGGELVLPFSDPLPPGDSVSLTLVFELDVPEHLGPLGYSERQLNLGDWYLFPPPYHPDRGWLIHEPASVGEHLVYDLYDFKVDLKLIGPEAGIVVASSAPAGGGDAWLHYRLAQARSFALSLSPVYDCMRSAAEGVNVEACFFPEHYAAGVAALRASGDALLLYERLFGTYPHATLTIVEAGFPDGMEYDGLYFLGQEYFAAYDGTPHNYLTMLTAHETAHQWWYGLAGNDQALEPWLDEACATYSELLFYEAYYPDATAWWWNYRVNRFHPTGWVDSTVYDYRDFRPYVNAVYLRGAQFLQELRGVLGDEAFFSLAHELVASNQRPVLSTQDFFAAAARYAGQDTHLAYDEFFHLNR